jgi:hypothetical protein
MPQLDTETLSCCSCDTVLYFIICFASVKLLFEICKRMLNLFHRSGGSSIIEPANYHRHDIYVRKCRITVNWNLFANKVRALYDMKVLRTERRIRAASLTIDDKNTLMRTTSHDKHKTYNGSKSE